MASAPCASRQRTSSRPPVSAGGLVAAVSSMRSAVSSGMAGSEQVLFRRCRYGRRTPWHRDGRTSGDGSVRADVEERNRVLLVILNEDVPAVRREDHALAVVSRGSRADELQRAVRGLEEREHPVIAIRRARTALIRAG